MAYRALRNTFRRKGAGRFASARVQEGEKVHAKFHSEIGISGKVRAQYRNLSTNVGAEKSASKGRGKGQGSRTAAATRERRQQLKNQQTMARIGITTAAVGIMGFGGFAMYKSRRGETVPLGPFEPVYNFIANAFNSQFGDLYEPMTEKLLPDRSKDIPPHIPVLVIDLEQTIVRSTWDRRHGWRSVKRPGLDEFLEQMRQHYEIILFSPTGYAIASAVVEQLDPQMKYFTHHLFRESTLYKNGQYIKDLSRLNRPLSRTIIIDDDAAAFQLQKENGIKVRPFADINDQSDTTLTDLIPLLKRLAKKPPSTDLRDELRKYEGRDIVATVHEEIVREREEAERAMNSGLGGAIRRSYNSRKVNASSKNSASGVKMPMMVAPANKPTARPQDVVGAGGENMQDLPPIAPLGSTPLQTLTKKKAKPRMGLQSSSSPNEGGAKKSAHRKTLWEWMAEQQKAAQMEQERIFREQQMRMRMRGGP